jgi:uncharacterized membrane protein
MLIVSTFILGWLGGVIIGGLTPWIALVRGILPLPLAPVIPFIIAGNIAFLLSYYFIGKFSFRFLPESIKNIGSFLGIALGAVVKYLILAAGVRFFVEVPPGITKMMQIPQLLTALAGGVLALIFINFLNRAGIINKER